MFFRIQKLITILTVPYYRNILVQTRVAASTEHTHVLKKLAQEKIITVVDVGANRGQFAIATRHHFPKAKLFHLNPWLRQRMYSKKYSGMTQMLLCIIVLLGARMKRRRFISQTQMIPPLCYPLLICRMKSSLGLLKEELARSV